jgi:hypothetical protein
MKRDLTREEILALQHAADPWLVERELLREVMREVKHSPQFKAAVARVVAAAERRLLAGGPRQIKPANAPGDDRLAEPGAYAPFRVSLQRPRGYRRHPYAYRLAEHYQSGVSYAELVLN